MSQRNQKGKNFEENEFCPELLKTLNTVSGISLNYKQDKSLWPWGKWIIEKVDKLDIRIENFYSRAPLRKGKAQNTCFIHTYLKEIAPRSYKKLTQ